MAKRKTRIPSDDEQIFDEYGNYKMPNQFKSDEPNTLNDFQKIIDSYSIPRRSVWLIYINNDLVQICGTEQRMEKEVKNWKQATGEEVKVVPMEVYD